VPAAIITAAASAVPIMLRIVQSSSRRAARCVS
jgi:hypothetical protein